MSESIADVLGRLARFVRELPPEFQADGFELMDAIYNVWSDDVMRFAFPPSVVPLEGIERERRYSTILWRGPVRVRDRLSRGLFRSTGSSGE